MYYYLLDIIIIIYIQVSTNNSIVFPLIVYHFFKLKVKKINLVQIPLNYVYYNFNIATFVFCL